VVYDDQLNELWSHEHSRPWNGTGVPEHLAVNRHTVRQILLSGLDDVVFFGKEFVRYEIDDKVTAHFADGSTASGDVLVAADGVNSAVRKQYLPYARIVDTGVRQLYGKIPLNSDTRDLFLDGMFTIFTPIVGPNRKYVGVAPVERREPIQRVVDRLAPDVRLDPNADYMSFGFGGRLEVLPCSDDELRTMTGPELLAMALDELAGWHPRVRRIAEHCDPETLFPLTLRTSVPIPRWRTTAVTLLGDAIHAMSPAGGVGANTALRDAGNLLRALTGDELGLERYEAEMTDYGFAAVRESAVNGQRTLNQNPLPVS
jgi:2-polyprenyl-6-methoxyphenol hydroxylase-like FAD-dependent oxidoreductase